MESLAKSLEDINLLSNVLRFADVSTLRASRLVCHLWRDTCSEQTPSLDWIPGNKLEAVGRIFPGTTAIKTEVSDEEELLEVVATISLMPITKLGVLLEHPCLHGADLPPLQSFEELREFKMVSTQEDVEMWLTQQIRPSPKLENLEIQVFAPVRAIASPSVEFSKLKRLCVDSWLLVDENGENLFVPTDTLTEIIIYHCSSEIGGPHVPLLNALEPYSGTVEKLSLLFDLEHEDDMHVDGVAATVDWSSLHLFGKIKSLILEDYVHLDDSFFNVIPKLKLLRKLDCGIVEYARDVIDRLSKLGLESLTIETSSYDYSPEYLAVDGVSRLTKLTELRITTTDAGSALGKLTRLVKLNVTMDRNTLIEVPPALPYLTELQEVTLVHISLSEALIKGLSELRKMKILTLTLSVTSIQIDESPYRERLFTALRTLPRLHRFELGCEEGFVSQCQSLYFLNYLDRLIHLNVSFETLSNPLIYLYGEYLHNLETLTVNCPVMEEADQAELRRTFPKLTFVENAARYNYA